MIFPFLVETGKRLLSSFPKLQMNGKEPVTVRENVSFMKTLWLFIALSIICRAVIGSKGINVIMQNRRKK